MYCPRGHFGSELVGAVWFFGVSFKVISNVQCRFVFCRCRNGKVKVTYLRVCNPSNEGFFRIFPWNE